MPIQSIPEIQKALMKTHEDFLSYLEGMDEETFTRAPEGKWNAGQQLEHIEKSTRAVAKALRLPNWFLKWRIGKANRPSRTYDELVARYEEKLEKVRGITAPGFGPGEVDVTRRKDLCAGVRRSIESINKAIGRRGEKDLDLVILPHPLLGKVTLREMLFFTVYHVEYHHKSVLSLLEHKA